MTPQEARTVHLLTEAFVAGDGDGLLTAIESHLGLVADGEEPDAAWIVETIFASVREVRGASGVSPGAAQHPDYADVDGSAGGSSVEGRLRDAAAPQQDGTNERPVLRVDAGAVSVDEDRAGELQSPTGDSEQPPDSGDLPQT